MKKYIRSFILLILLAAVAAVCFYAWLAYDLYEAGKTDVWNSDAPPNAEMKVLLAEQGFPDSVTRVVKVGASSRWNGDGEDLTICCFPVADLGKVKKALGDSSVWIDGLPPDGYWLAHIKAYAPKDLVIPASAKGSDYIHLPTTSGRSVWVIIDVRRGVSYQVQFRT